jgi:hypothetical protein
MDRHRFAASLLAIQVAAQAALLAGGQGPALRQDGEEARLRSAIARDPGELQHYFRLADVYRDRGRFEQADRTLQDALGVDPANPLIHERRVSLFVKPFDPMRLGRIAEDWVSVDGINPAPVLLAAGHRLRRASGMRGDGTRASQDQIDAGLEAVNGALPSHPDHSGLLLAQAQLLEASAALAADRAGKERGIADAWAIRQRVRALEAVGPLEPGLSGPLAVAVQAMLQPVPFGPPGAVRAPAVVPIPRRLTQTRIPASRIPAGARPSGLALELVIDTTGRVIQIHPLDSAEGYDVAIADEIKRWVYEPTRLYGEPVRVILGVWLPTRR